MDSHLEKNKRRSEVRGADKYAAQQYFAAFLG